MKYRFEDLTKDERLYLEAKHTYYKGEPIMSDESFDILEDKLIAADSFVVDIVGDIKMTTKYFDIVRPKNTIEHDSPMGSLDKVKFQKDYTPYREFELKFLNKYDEDCDVEITPKFDGNAISIKYVDGNLIHIGSRGDGTIGQDYTNLGLNVPQKVDSSFTGEIRGEAVIDVDLFDEKYGINSDLDKKFANARNFVAGSLNKGIKSRIDDIDIIAFNIAGYDGNDTLNRLRKYGFQVPTFTKIVKKSELDLKGFEKLYTEMEQYRYTSRYQLDGFVLKYPEHLREDIGGNNHHPFWAVAIKYVAEEVTTEIIGIDWTLGKRGQLTPVAVLKPVQLMGSIVQRASLYNASWMLNNKCFVGATVTLVKSGDIIPTIIDVVEESTQDFELPTEYEGEKTSYNGVELLMENYQYSDAYKSKMMYHSISSLGIKYIGEATSKRIYDAGVGLLDLFKHTPHELKQIFINSGEFVDGRELEKMIEHIFKLTSVEVWQIIYSFGYIDLGKNISNELAKYIYDLDYDFKGLNRSVIEAFVSDVSRKNEIFEMIDTLEKSGVEVIKPQAPNADAIKICMTGSPKPFGYGTKTIFLNEFENVIEYKLNKDCDYLITDSLVSTTSKMKKAEKLGVKIMTYGEFFDMLND